MSGPFKYCFVCCTPMYLMARSPSKKRFYLKGLMVKFLKKNMLLFTAAQTSNYEGI